MCSSSSSAAGSARRAAQAAFSASNGTRNSASSRAVAERKRSSAPSAPATCSALGSATNAPPREPVRISITPWASSARSASRRVVRETPKVTPSSRSLGSRSPGAMPPEAIASRIWPTMWSNERTR